MSQNCLQECSAKPRFPMTIFNRPGLPKIDYRIGSYADILESMLHSLNKSGKLSEWTHRLPHDPGIALLEGAAILGDILTFYQSLYANEAYLRTALWRTSISDLVRLLGYRLSPAVGGKATFAFAVKGDNPIVIPAGFPVKAQVDGLESPADFETIKKITAYPWQSKFNLYRGISSPYIDSSTTEFFISSPDQYTNPVSLEEGDRLLVGEPDPNSNPTRLKKGEIIIIDKIRKLHGLTIFKIKGALKRTVSIEHLYGYKLGRSFRHFGHNALPKYIEIDTSHQATEYHISYARYYDRTTSPVTVFWDGNRLVLDPSLKARVIPLDSQVDDLSVGMKLIIFGEFYYLNGDYEDNITAIIRTITDVRPGTMVWGANSGPTTFITLDSPGGAETIFYINDIRNFNIHETDGSILRLSRLQEDTSAATGYDLYFCGTDKQAQNLIDRKLLFEYPTEDPLTATVTAVGTYTDYSKLHKVTLDSEIDLTDFPNEDPTMTVYGNLADADQGKTEKKAVLGNGDNREIFQTFKLPKAPLTYHLSASATPPEVPELQIWINDIKWTRVASFFGHTSKDQIYIVREDAKGDSWVQFGDGKTGLRLPSGEGNVVAIFRTGVGAYGALKEGTKVQAGGKQKNLDKVFLPGKASGGSEPEAGGKAKQAAPGKVQSLGRLVGLKDFESEALAISGVAKANASWGLINNVPRIIVTVLMTTGAGKDAVEVQTLLNKYNRCRGAWRFPVSVIEGEYKHVHLKMNCQIDPTHSEDIVKSDIIAALGIENDTRSDANSCEGLFSLSQREFGMREYENRVLGKVQNVKGVIWAMIDEFYPLEQSNSSGFGPPSDYLTNPVHDEIPCGNAQILTLLAEDFSISIETPSITGECNDG